MEQPAAVKCQDVNAADEASDGAGVCNICLRLAQSDLHTCVICFHFFLNVLIMFSLFGLSVCMQYVRLQCHITQDMRSQMRRSKRVFRV